MVTMMDVAKYAKVSKMTVSRVLSGNGYVKEQTRQAVLQAVQELGYRPNLLAKSLATGHSQIVAYVLPDICDPFFGNVCKAVTQVCEELGYTAIVSNAPNADALEKFLDMAIDRKLDGVIFHHLPVTQQQADRMLQSGIQVVLMDNEHPVTGAVTVNNDNYRGGGMAAAHLLACGYRRIVCIRGSEEGEGCEPAERQQQRVWEDRTRGFLDTLQQAGVAPFGFYCGSGSAYMDKAFPCGQALARQILAQRQWPDAIYCQSDLIALGILGEFLERGIPVPGTIALCGHDGLDICRHLFPRITTVALDQQTMGRTAAQLLIGQIGQNDPPRQAAVASELFLGDTTATAQPGI